MDKWIRDLIAASVYGVKKLAEAAIERIAVVYSLIVSVGLAIRGGWGRLLTMFYFWRDKLSNMAREYYLTMWYIIFVRIPATLSNAVDSVIRYLGSVISSAVNALTFAINEVLRWTSDWVHRIVDAANRLTDWIFRQVNQIIDVLNRLGALVFVLLTDPRRMARWVMSALIMEAVQFATDNAESIGELVRARSVVYAGRIAARIEEVLVKML